MYDHCGQGFTRRVVYTVYRLYYHMGASSFCLLLLILVGRNDHLMNFLNVHKSWTAGRCYVTVMSANDTERCRLRLTGSLSDRHGSEAMSPVAAACVPSRVRRALAGGGSSSRDEQAGLAV